MVESQHGDIRKKVNANDVRRKEINDNIIKRNKNGSFRKKPGRKSLLSKLIPIERSDDREVINNLPRSESIENLEFMETNNANMKEPRTNDNEKALLRRRDLEIEALQEQIKE